jgi:hypothetical protein
VIPRTLAQNCGTGVLRILTQLRAKHASGQEPTWGINGETGQLADMNVRVWCVVVLLNLVVIVVVVVVVFFFVYFFNGEMEQACGHERACVVCVIV